MTVVNQFVSDIFFYISGTCWVILLIPQLIENHKNKDSESLSLGFLWCWLIGDLFYLTGAIFQNLLWSTIWITIMYLLNDVALMGQTLYYRYTKSPISSLPPNYIASERSRLLANNTDANRATPPVDVNPRRAEDIPTSSYTSAHQNSVQSYDSKAFVNLGVSLKSILPLFLINFTILFNFTNSSSNPSHLGLFMITGNGGENNDIVWWAQLCGWISTALYTGAKLPQIHLNYTRKTCQGLSKWLFIISLLANGTFILSIVSYSTEVAFIIKSIPWIMGALGPMFLDLVILGQFYYYNKLLGNSDSDEYLA